MDDRMTPMEAEVLEMTPPVPVGPSDSYGTAPRPRQKKSHVGLWVTFGLAVILVCSFSVVAAALEIRLGWDENGRLRLSMGAPAEPANPQQPLRDLPIPTDDTDYRSESAEGADPGVRLFSAENGTELTADALYAAVNPGVICLELNSYYGSEYATGVVISEDGYILSATGGLSDKLSLLAWFSDGTSSEAAKVWEDPVTGVCLLKTEANHLTPLLFEEDRELFVGSTVYCIGNPYGKTLPNILYTGMLSGQKTVTLTGEDYTLLKGTEEMSNAGYGCPLFNSRGHVVGITTAVGARIWTEGSDPRLAISAGDLQRIVSDHTGRNADSQSWLGFEVEQIPLEYQFFGNLPDRVWIAEVSRSSPVYDVLLPGDVIIKVNGEEILTTEQFYAALAQSPPETYAAVVLYRDHNYYYARVPVLCRNVP